MQNAVNEAILNETLTPAAYAEYKSINLELKRQPYPPYNKDLYVLVLQQQFPLVIMLSLVVMVLGIVRDIVLEKERRLKVRS